MIKLTINHTKIMASNLGTLAEGNINSISINFIFSAEWDNLARVAVFSNGTSMVSVLLSSDTCVIPWEVLAEQGELYVALKGVGNGGNLVLCTENEFLGKVRPSNASRDTVEAEDATPDVIDTLLADVAELKENGGGGTGANGKSAYEIALESGFTGSETDWLNSLKGAAGADGTTPVKGVDYWTDADKQAIVAAVIADLPVYNGDVE